MEERLEKLNDLKLQKLRDCCNKRGIEQHQNKLKSLMQGHECVEEQEYYNLPEVTEKK